LKISHFYKIILFFVNSQPENIYNFNLLLLMITESENSPIATIVIRGATDNIMDDIERAIDDGVNAYKVLAKV